jgi:Na+/melibiose symporter-like transporter
MSFITGIGLVGAAIPYYVANILGEGEQMIGIVFLAWLLGSLFMLPLWTFCAAKTGKKVALQLAVLLFCFAAVLIFTVGVGIAKSGLLIAIGCMGIAYGGMQVLPFSMLTDTIQFDSQKNGGNRAGAFSGIWIASEKIGLAIGAAAMGMLLSSAGYVQKTGGSVEQPEAVAEAILMGLSIYPAICIATGFGFLIFYSLRGSDLVQQEIVEP